MVGGVGASRWDSKWMEANWIVWARERSAQGVFVCFLDLFVLLLTCE